MEAGWYARLFRRAAKIYDDDARLWLSAQHLLDPTTIPDRRSPNGPLIPDLDVRPLLESVYAAEDDVRGRTPQALHRRMDEAAGAGRAEARLGHLNTLFFEDGLLRDWNKGNSVLGEDESAPTRLGGNHAVVLVEHEGQEVRFLVMGDDPLEDSLCRSPQRLRNAPEDEASREYLQRLLRTAAQRRRFRWHEFVVLEQTGNSMWRGMATSDANKRIAVTYDAFRGLRLQRG